MLDGQYNNDYNEKNFKIDVKKTERKYSWSTVFAWLYLNTIGKILPKKWNKWAENILNPYEVTAKFSNNGFTELEESGQSQTTGAELNPQLSGTIELEEDNQSQTPEEEKKILVNSIENQEQRIKELTEKLEKSKKEIEELYSDRKVLLQKLEITEKESKLKNTELKALQEDADKTAQDYGNRISDLLKEISELKNKFDAATAREKKIQELEKAHGKLEKQFISEQNKVNLLQNKSAALRKEKKGLEQSLDETKRQLESYKKQSENAVQNPQNEQTSKNEIQEQLEAKVRELENKLEATKESNQKLQEKLEQQIKQLEVAKKQLEDEIQNLQNGQASEKNKIQKQQKPDIISSSTKKQGNQPKNSHPAIDTSKLNYPCLNGDKCHGDFFEGEKLYASARLGPFAEFSKFLTDCNKEIKSKENGRFCNTKKSITFNFLNRNSKNSVFSGKSIFHNAVERTIKCLLHRDYNVFSKSELHDIFTYNIHKLIKNEMSSLTDKYNSNLFLREIEGLIEELVSEVEKEFLKKMCDFKLENVGYELKKEVVEKCQSPSPKVDSPIIGMLRRISTQSTP